MHRIKAAKEAFAALLADGSVVTWGNAELGGDSSRVQERLTDVQDIQAQPRLRLLPPSSPMDLS